jgi:putative zinc finger/helix-turn-helix YgiT family protein
MKRYCFACGKDVEAQPVQRRVTRKIDGVEIAYEEKVLLCPVCGNEIYDAGFSDANVQTANTLYRQEMGLVTVAEIKALCAKFKIGEKPLAQLLGWGEVTLVRYCKGAMPSKQYSDVLKSLENPFMMLKLFKANGDRLTGAARKKLGASIEREISVRTNKLLAVANYILSKVDEASGDFMTPLKLQKMVCLAQGWALGLLNRPLFEQEIEAWPHGPVVYDLYEFYKDFKFNPIPALSDCDTSVFTMEELAVLTMVNDVFGVYNATFLENLTHKEKPWQAARGELKVAAPCHTRIAKDKLLVYYQRVMQKFGITTAGEAKKIEKYVLSLGV